jgi:hypothetical protein
MGTVKEEEVKEVVVTGLPGCATASSVARSRLLHSRPAHDLTSASDPRICGGPIHKRGLDRAPPPITRPSEEPSNAQSEHVQDRIGTRLRAGGSNTKTEHDVSRASSQERF